MVANVANTKLKNDWNPWYTSKSTQRELSNEYQTRQGLDDFQKSLRPCALDGSILSIGRINTFIFGDLHGKCRLDLWYFWK